MLNMKTKLYQIFLALLVLLPTHLAFGNTGGPKIIEWGWGTPPPTYVREHIRDMEKLPFDGLVLDLKGNLGTSAASDYVSWNVWTSKTVALDNYSESYQALKDTEFNRFTDNFLRFNVTPGDVDWFDKEFSNVIANAVQIARVAKTCKLKGILLDVEQYKGKPFDYSVQPEKNRYSFLDYQKQVEQCGRRFIASINQVFPDITILLTYGYHLSYARETVIGTNQYGLLPFFLDGILEAASPDTLIIDGWEFSYGYKSEKQFQEARSTIYRNIEGRSSLSPRARQRYQCSFGLWLDNRKIWENDTIDKNYFTPEEFSASLRFAMKYTDRYVWVYSEKANLWNGKVPKPYLDALIEARFSSSVPLNINRPHSENLNID